MVIEICPQHSKINARENQRSNQEWTLAKLSTQDKVRRQTNKNKLKKKKKLNGCSLASAMNDKIWDLYLMVNICLAY